MSTKSRSCIGLSKNTSCWNECELSARKFISNLLIKGQTRTLKVWDFLSHTLLLFLNAFSALIIHPEFLSNCWWTSTYLLPPFLILNSFSHRFVKGHLRLTELDQVLVRGSWMETTDVQVGFAQLVSTAAASITAGGGGGVGTGRRHLLGGGRIRLLWKQR